MLQDQVFGDSLIWRAVVDNCSSSQPFLPAMPLELYELNEGSFVPFLMGTNRDEGVLKLCKSSEETISLILDFRINVDKIFHL